MSDVTLTLGTLDAGTLRMAVDNYERVCHDNIAMCRMKNISHGVWDDCIDSLDKIRRSVKQTETSHG